MVKARKKPVTVEAEQFLEDVKPWPKNVHVQGRVPYVVTIHSQEAWLEDGDWVIQEEMEGRAYPCKPDIFEKTYDILGDGGTNGK